MTKQEFETMTAQRVSDENFAAFNEMYMCAGELDKQTFCEAIKDSEKSGAIRKLLVALTTTSSSRASKLEKAHEDNDKMTRANVRLAEILIGKSVDHYDDELYNEAVAILGYRNSINFKLDNTIELSKADIEYIKQNLL